MKNPVPGKWHLHVLIWAIFIVYEIAVVYSFTGAFYPLWDYVNNYLANILLFYAHAHFVLRYSLDGRKKSYIRLAFFVLVQVAIYMILKYLIAMTHPSGQLPGRQIKSFYSFFAETIWRAVYFIGLSTGYWFALNTIAQRKKISDLLTAQLKGQLARQLMEKKLLSVEKAYLQSQINPHFPFNTLGFIHSSADKLSKQLGNTVMELSEMMRYAFNKPAADDKVELEEEIWQVQHLISLNRQRFQNGMYFSLTVTGDPEGLRIIPLSLLTLIENVFKYAELNCPDTPATIDINIHGRKLNLLISNTKRNANIPSGTGLGIENVKLRSQQHYPGKYQLDIRNEETGYCLELKIEL